MYLSRFTLTLGLVCYCSQSFAQVIGPWDIEKLEMEWAGQLNLVEERLQPSVRPRPESAIWSFQVNHVQSRTNLRDTLDLWVDKHSRKVNVRYRAPFLVEIQRQLALLQPSPTTANTESAIRTIRMIDFFANEDTHPELRLAERTSQLIDLRVPMAVGNPARPPEEQVDGCQLGITIQADPDLHFTSDSGDQAVDSWVEEFTTALRLAWTKDRLTSFASYLDQDCITKIGSDFLTRASSASNFALAQELIRMGVDPQKEDSSGNLPLVEASGSGNIPLIELLLDHGAKPDLASRVDGINARIFPLDLAMNSALWGPDRAAGVETVRFLLEHGASPNNFGHGEGSPLQRARAQGNTALIDMLLKAGARR